LKKENIKTCFGSKNQKLIKKCKTIVQEIITKGNEIWKMLSWKTMLPVSCFMNENVIGGIIECVKVTKFKIAKIQQLNGRIY
jgi:hypothetical protein